MSRLTVKPTRAGSATAVTQLAANEAASAERWSTLPGITAVNRIDAVKPGATVLLNGTDESRAERPMLAFQRYGRGKAFSFLPQDSWIWQMHASIPVEDMTHENYWRQLLRWVVDDVPDQVEPSLTTERVEPGEAATLVANVVDPSFVELNDAVVMATITGPDGTDLGPAHVVGWRARRPIHGVGADQGAGLVRGQAAGDPRRQDHRHAPSRTSAPRRAKPSSSTRPCTPATLRRIAEETGGRYYEAANTATLADDLRYTGRGVTVGGRARPVAHADRADAAGRPAVRRMGVPTCRRPRVTRWPSAGAGGLRWWRRGRSPPKPCAKAAGLSRLSRPAAARR